MIVIVIFVSSLYQNGTASCFEVKEAVEISSRLPDKFDLAVQGYHRRCYQLFKILPHASKRKATSCTVADDELPSTSEKGRRSSAASPASSTVLFPVDKCLVYEKGTIYVKRVKHSLVTCITATAEASIKFAALEKGDEEILRKIRDQDLSQRGSLS